MIELETLFAKLDVPEAARELDRADPSLEEAAMAAIRGDYARAAQLAAARYADGFFDARLLGYLLYGVLLERGPSALELLLRTVQTVLTDKRAALGPAKRKEVLLDGALNWFFGKLIQELERAEHLRNETWQKWHQAAAGGALAGALYMAQQLPPLLSTLVAKPRAPVPLLQLVDLLQQLIASTATANAQQSMESTGDPGFSSAETLSAAQSEIAPAPADEQAADERLEATAPTPPDQAPSREIIPSRPTPDPTADAPGAEAKQSPLNPEPAERAAPQLPQERYPPGAHLCAPAAPRRLPPGFVTASTVQAGAALMALARQIEQFVALVDKHDHLHAAVVAAAVQRAIDTFDPRLYLPALFLPYFRALSSCSSQLAPILEHCEQLTFRTLTQLYQIDPEAFAAESPIDDASIGHQDPVEEER